MVASLKARTGYASSSCGIIASSPIEGTLLESIDVLVEPRQLHPAATGGVPIR
jgi:hypothetical protein